MEDVTKRADVKELILSVITRLSENAQNEWRAVKWDDVKATCRRMGISNKETESHFSRLIREVELMEDANDPSSIYMRLRPQPSSGSLGDSGAFALEDFDHRQSLTNRTSGFAPRHRFTVGSTSSSAEGSQELDFPHAPFSDGGAAGRVSGFGSKSRERTNGFGTSAGGRRDRRHDRSEVKKEGTFGGPEADMKANFQVRMVPRVLRQRIVESKHLEDTASTRVFGFGRSSPFTVFTDSRIIQDVSVTHCALENASTLLVEHAIGQTCATDGSEDSSSDDTDLDGVEIIVPETPPSDLEDLRQSGASVSVGLATVAVGLMTVIYTKILQCVSFFCDGFTGAIKLLRPTCLSTNPPDSNTTDQIPEATNAAKDAMNRPASERSDNSCTDAQPGLTESGEVECKTAPASNSSLVKEDAIAEGSSGGHALLIAAITMNVASRAPRSISTEDLLLILRAQYGRDVNPLVEAGVDVPFSEFVRRYCSAVFVDEGPDEQANYLLKKKKSELCGHLRHLLGWAVD